MRGNQPWTLGNDAFEARVVVGKALDLGVRRRKLRKNVGEPDCRTGNLVLQVERIENLGDRLADGDDAVRRSIEPDIDTAVLQRQRIGGLRRGLAGEAKICRQSERGNENSGVSPIGSSHIDTFLGNPAQFALLFVPAGLLTDGSMLARPSRGTPVAIRAALTAYSCGGSSV